MGSATGNQMSPTSKDLIASVVAGTAIMAMFVSFELVENLYELTCSATSPAPFPFSH